MSGGGARVFPAGVASPALSCTTGTFSPSSSITTASPRLTMRCKIARFRAGRFRYVAISTTIGEPFSACADIHLVAKDAPRVFRRWDSSDPWQDARYPPSVPLLSMQLQVLQSLFSSGEYLPQVWHRTILRAYRQPSVDTSAHCVTVLP